MSKGVLIFAYNSNIDYVSIATVAARLAKKYLDLPVTLVTNVDWADTSVFDQVIIRELTGTSYTRVFNFAGEKQSVQWHNQNRSSAYDLSPYDQTLLLDADYLIFNSDLKRLFDTDLEFACYDAVTDISGWNGLQAGARVGNPGIPMQWATVVYFTRNELAQGVFEMMSMVKENYKYYSAVYNFTMELFRNDFTLSIALQTLTGYNTSNFTAIPGVLTSANTTVELLEARPNGDLVFNWSYNDHVVNVTRIKDTSVHIMNKKSITNSRVLQELTELSK
jgi:hypothetical protein